MFARIRFLAILRMISKTIATTAVATATMMANVYSLSKLDNLPGNQGPLVTHGCLRGSPMACSNAVM